MGFKVAGALNLKLKKKPATAARKGVNPFTKEPCVFKAKPASQTVKVLPMKKIQDGRELRAPMIAYNECKHSRCGSWWAVSPGPPEHLYSYTLRCDVQQ